MSGPVIITLVRCRGRGQDHDCLQWCAVAEGTQAITDATQILFNSADQDKAIDWAVSVDRPYRIAQVPLQEAPASDPVAALIAAAEKTLKSNGLNGRYHAFECQDANEEMKAALEKCYATERGGIHDAQ